MACRTVFGLHRTIIFGYSDKNKLLNSLKLKKNSIIRSKFCVNQQSFFKIWMSDWSFKYLVTEILRDSKATNLRVTRHLKQKIFNHFF